MATLHRTRGATIKQVFVVIDYEQNGKHRAIVDSVQLESEIIPIIKSYANVRHVGESRKEANKIAQSLNDAYKVQGRYWCG